MSCCGEPDLGSGVPSISPPCTHESCSVGFLPLDETGGALGPFVRVVGGLLRPLVRRLSAGQTARPGVLTHFHDADGNCLGLGVDLAGRPEALSVDCGNYVNPIREVANGDGTFALGGFPLPYQDKTCVGDRQSCSTMFPPGTSGDIHGVTADGGCGPNPTNKVTNDGCWPINVTPIITIKDASLGPGPVTMLAELNVNGSGWGSPIEVFSSLQGSFTILDGGAGDTSVDGAQPAHNHPIPDHAQTSSSGGHTHNVAQRNTDNANGPDQHNHAVPGVATNQAGAHTHTLADHGNTGNDGAFDGHLHTIGDHSHNVDAFTGRASYSGSIVEPNVVVAPGETFTYEVRTSIRYDADVTEPAELNFGTVTLCLDYASQINAETIAALEAG